MRRRSNARRRLIVANPEHTAMRLSPGHSAPAGDERTREGDVEEIDRYGIIQHAARPGVIAQPSAPQFSSSQAVICV